MAVSGLTGVVHLHGGRGHSLALLADGTVRAWGYNAFGGLGDGTFTERTRPVRTLNLTGVVALAGGRDHSLALKSDGTVWGVRATTRTARSATAR